MNRNTIVRLWALLLFSFFAVQTGTLSAQHVLLTSHSGEMVGGNTHRHFLETHSLKNDREHRGSMPDANGNHSDPVRLRVKSESLLALNGATGTNAGAKGLVGPTDPPVADFSASPLTVCVGNPVSFTNLSTLATGYSWSFGASATPSTSTDANPTVVYSAAGTYAVTLTATNANGSDVETKTAYITVLAGTTSSLPLSEGFTSATFPPTGWSVVNANASSTWSRNASVGGFAASGNSMMFDNYSINDGDDDQIRVKAVDLSSVSSAVLTFDVAYASYSATNYDGLEVLVSTNCGGSFTSVYSKSGTTLATASTTTAMFTPTASQWRTETINLSAYIGQSNVIVAFKNLSGYGNRLFVDNVNIASTSTPYASFSASQYTVCAGQTVTVTDGSVNASSWSWDFGSGATPATATGVGPHSVTYSTSGTKTLTLTVNGSVTYTQTVTVNATPAAPSITASGSTTFCAGGSVTLTSSSNSGNTWSNGATTPTITVGSGGTYTVTATSGGCTSAASAGTLVTVNPVPSAPTITASGSTTFCAGSSVTLTSSSASGNVWSNGATTPSITVTSAGTYSVAVTNGSCTSLSSAGKVITVNAIPSSPTVTASGPTTFCSGGSVTLTSSSSTGNTWSNGATTQSITVNAGATYTVTNTVNGCTSPASAGTLVTVNTIPSEPVISASGSTTFCTGSTVTLTSSSATGNVWSNGATTPSITVSNAGTYTVTATINGCTSPASAGTVITVNAIPSTPNIIASGPTTFCSGGSVTLTSTSPSGNNWSNGATTPSITVTGGGTYTVTTTANGCTSASSAGTAVVVNATPSAPTISAGGATTFCSGGSVTLTSSSPTGNTWSTGETTQSITAISGGTYSVVTTTGSCTSSASSGVVVTVNPIPSTPNIFASGPVNICSGSSVTLTSSSLTGNVWSNGATTPSITVTSAGSYNVSVTSGGCTSQPSAGTNVSLIAVPSINAGTITNPTTCSSLTGAIQVTGSGTGTLNWSGAASGSMSAVTLPATINGLGAGSYQVTFTNASGCSSNVLTQTITDPAAPATPVVTASGSTTICAGGSVTLTSSYATGNVWSNGSTTQSIVVSDPGLYQVAVSSSGCSSISTGTMVTVTPLPATPTITANGSTSFCEGGSVVLTSSSATGNTWSNGSTSQSITVSNSGNYTVTTSGNGCTSNPSPVQVVTVSNIPATPAITAGGITTFCSGGNVVLTSSSPTGNIWSNGATTQSITVTSGGSYSVSVNNNGCASGISTSVPVTVNPTPVISAGTVTEPATCGGANGSIVINGSGTGSLFWTGSTLGSMFSATLPVTISGLSAGSYNITFTQSGGCASNLLSQSLSDPNAPAIPVITASGPLSFCEGESVTLTSSAATGNVWSDGSATQSITVSVAGNYSVAVSNDNGCMSGSLATEVIVIPRPVLAAGPHTAPQFCGSATGIIQVNGSGAGDLHWSGDATGISTGVILPASVTGVPAGIYGIYMVSEDGCISDTLDQSLADPSAPSAPVITWSDNTPCTGDTIVLTSSYITGNSWSNGSTSNEIVATTNGTYTVNVTDGTGCTSAATTVTITYHPIPFVLMDNIDTMCVYNSPVTLYQGFPQGGTYSGIGVTGNQFDPEVAGSGITIVNYTYTSPFGCTNSSWTSVFVDECAGLEESQMGTIRMFPNPSTAMVSITSDNDLIRSITVYDQSGRLVSTFTPSEYQTEIDLSAQAEGMYTVTVLTEKGISKLPLMIQR